MGISPVMKTGETAKYRQMLEGYKKGSFQTVGIARGDERRYCLYEKVAGLADAH
ncbi:hypothetical protein ACTM3U_24410 [Citrobacter freundii]